MSTKSELARMIDGLVTSIFEAEDRRLTKKETELVSKNRNLQGPDSKGQRLDGFYYNGMYYTDLDSRLLSKGVRGSLHPSLVPDIELHVKDQREVTFDKARVKQALVLLIKDCISHQDLRDNLPNIMTDMIPEIRALPRTRPEAYTLENNPRAIKQYEKLRDKIQFYITARMLY